MADSRVINLTAANSSATVDASSVFFLAIAPDDTPLAVAGSELGQRVSNAGGFFSRTVTDQGVNHTGKTALNIDSVIWGTDWWNVLSPNIVTVPDDTYRSVQFIWEYISDALGGGTAQSGVRYTTVTSTKYSNEFPESWESGIYTSIGALFETLPSASGDAHSAACSTFPIGVESGDQFEVYVDMTGSDSPNISQFSFGANPIRRY